MKRWSMLLAMFGLTGCAFLHHVQIGEIDNRNRFSRKKFDIKVSETGLSLQDAGAIAQALSRSKRSSNAIGQATTWLGYFQFGPKTGNPVFVEDYARNIGMQIWEACPSGQVTGLNAIRETNRYPVVSGEIIRITGYCLKPR